MRKDRIYTLAWSPDGAWLVLGSNDGTARVWDVASGEHLAVLDEGVARTGRHGPEEPILAVDWSRDRRSIATVGSMGLVSVWDVSPQAIQGDW